MTHRRYWVYFLLFLFNVICYLDRINMSVAGRSVAQDFGLSSIQLGYLFSSFLWAYVAMMLPSGRLVDGLGAHRVAAIGAAFWSVAQMLTGATTGFATMILARLGLGAGEAPTFPVSYRGVRDWAPYSERGLAVGLIQAGTLFGPALSAPLVAWLIAATSWRWSFFITGAIGLVWVAVWLAFVSTPERTRWLPDNERQRILAERHGDEPLAAHGGVGYRGLLRSPSMWGLAISQGCAVYSVYLYLSWLPNYLQTARGLSIVNSGLFTSVPFLVGGVVIILTNWIGDKILTPQTMRNGARRIVVVACLLLCSVGIAIPFVASLTAVVILTIFPVSFGGTASATNAALANDLLRSQSDSGRAFAFMVLGGNVFGLLAPIVTGYIVQITGSFSSAFILAGALSLIGAAVSFTLTRYTLGEERPVAVGFARGAA
jgi:ACS family glucarate transporter-like MFS transporter